MPTPAKPARLVVLETAGWAVTDDASKAAFREILDQLAAKGVAQVDRRADTAVDAFEASIQDAGRIASDITGWENRWSQRNILDEHPGRISARALAGLEKAEAMTPGDYERLLDERAAAMARHAALVGLADAAITLSCPGPAPLLVVDRPGQPPAPHATGNAVFNYPSSLVGAPVVTLPLIAVGGLPVGVQVMGQPGGDAKVTAIARWIWENVRPAVV